MENIFRKIKKPKNFVVKTNLLKNRYVTDGIIWTVDETIFNKETKLVLVISINTRAILGYIYGRNCQNEDLILELYKKILDDYEFSIKPCFVHSDMEETYHSEKVQKFLESEKIYVSTTEGRKNQNQLSESANNRIKYLVAQELISDTNSRAYREFSRSLPEKLRSISKKSQKCNDKEYRQHLFESKLFKNRRQEVIEKAIREFNNTDFIEGISRQEAQYYDNFIKGRNIENTRLVASKDMYAQVIKNDNISAIKQAQKRISNILKSTLNTEEKIAQIVTLVIEKQDSSTELMQQGFIGLAIQNTALQEKIEKLQADLDIVTSELKRKNEQEELILQQRDKRKNRKRLPEKEPITEEIYEFLIDRSNRLHRETYNGARLRLALALLCITGVRISELLPLTVSQIENLFEKSWIAIDRRKRGPSSHKAFLTPKGTKIIKKRARDFEIVLYGKNKDSYVFTAQYSDNPLNRVSFSRIINEFLKESTQKLSNQPNIRSHSFRGGFISQLWRDTGDIEFVRQAVGHAKISTTSQYVQNLSQEEIQKRMIKIQTSDDLFL